MSDGENGSESYEVALRCACGVEATAARWRARAAEYTDLPYSCQDCVTKRDTARARELTVPAP